MARRRAPVILTALAVATMSFGALGVAAPPSAAAPLPLPSTELASAAITSADGASGREDLFTRSANGTLSQRVKLPGGSWSRAIALGGTLKSQPAAVSWGSGRIDVFARGTDDTLQHRWFSGGVWSSWESLGGVLTSAPAATSWGPGRLDVVARGGDNAAYHKSFATGQGWSTWERLGGTISSSPTVTTWGTGRLDVFAVGGGSQIYHKWFTGSTWVGWERLGGTATSQPAAAAPGVGLLDIFYRGTDGAMWLKRYVRGSGWTGWVTRGGGFSSGPGAMTVGDDVRVVGRSPNTFIYESLRTSPTGAWGAWTQIDPYLPFRRLATWVDVFDYATLDPAVAVPDMKARGVQVLNLSTARFNGTTDFFDAAEAGQWLDLAHQNGIKVVGWYLPAYGDMTRDVRRTVAIAQFVSPGGQRFDGVGVDIERLDEVTLAQFNTLAVTHLAQVRAQTTAMLTAIVPSPFGTDPGNRWEGFPWAGVGAQSDVVVPMALWTFRANANGTPYSPDQVYAWVLDQVQRAHSLSGKPISVEGGVDDPGTENTPITADRVTRFVDAAIAGGALGGSHYDYATTAVSLWALLARLNTL